MADFKVTVYLDSNGTHLHQIYTGLFLLSQNKEIDLVLRPGISITKDRPNRQFLALLVERAGLKAKCIFDLQDSPVIGLPGALSWCDIYFKRSLECETFSELSECHVKKIHPFGFNYQVVSSSKAYFLQRFFLEFISRPYNPLVEKNRFHLSNWKEYFEAVWNPDVSPLLTPQTLSPSRIKLSNNILFQCRLWDPAQMAERNRDDAEKINNQRIELIRRLKAEFGDNFVGGLQHNNFTQRVAPDLLIDSKQMAKRLSYIDLVKNTKIVISSPGLLGSNGWKLGEYIALGKCIISERITTYLPGKFEAETHYASHTGVDSCIDRAVRLFRSQDEVETFILNTERYYHSELAPDILMRNHLYSATGM